jgi:hypothetical protein
MFSFQELGGFVLDQSAPANPVQSLRNVDLRRAATRFVKRSGISYIPAPVVGPGPGVLGEILVEQQREFGLDDIGESGGVHLLRIQP